MLLGGLDYLSATPLCLKSATETPGRIQKKCALKIPEEIIYVNEHFLVQSLC